MMKKQTKITTANVTAKTEHFKTEMLWKIEVNWNNINPF